MTNDERNPKPECRKLSVVRSPVSSFLRISSFVIRIWERRFMESRLSFLRMHWDHELPGGCSAGVLACEFTGRPARCLCWRRDAAATRRRDACATGRFMESVEGGVGRDQEVVGDREGLRHCLGELLSILRLPN